MSTSVLLLLVAVGCGVVFAALAVWAQARTLRGLRTVSWGVPAGILVFCTLFGATAFLIDDSVAEKTLFEVDAEGSAGVPVGSTAPVRVFDVVVEHPRVEHSLLVDPRLEFASAQTPIELHVRLTDTGGLALVDELLLLDVDCSGRSVYCGWESWTTTFVPSAAAPHRLEVTVLTVDVPIVHLRVEDPEKTDGRRAPGY